MRQIMLGITGDRPRGESTICKWASWKPYSELVDLYLVANVESHCHVLLADWIRRTDTDPLIRHACFISLSTPLVPPATEPA
jgi:hypothetical protein